MENGAKHTRLVNIWGGIECTVNRVGATYSDQLVRNGHEHRITDLDRFAELGIRTLRYPIVWERTAPDSLQSPAWEWADQRLQRLQTLGIRPIVGLVHHGSGPTYASMENESFVTGLAQYARLVAERYPWVEYYTPVNEPLTTARFCGLYGHWYPHQRAEAAFLRLLYHECKATVLAMQEIRKVQPNAKLVQTEDLGQTHSTSLLQYQAQFENERRWLSLDMLCGRIKPDHWMWGHLTRSGLSRQELAFFWDNPCPPDIIGINHYLTSERYLDDNIHWYPPHLHGGNGRHAYVDVEAVRIPEVEVVGPYRLLRQVWERYGLPIAVTEVHLGCTREDQLRWFTQVWQAANRLKQEGVDLRAVTAWAMLGSYDWNSLLVQSNGYYEPGLYDLRAPEPRLTGIAHLVKEIIAKGTATHPVLDSPGWWQRDDRWLIRTEFPTHICASSQVPNKGKPILITGATGTLGQAFANLCTKRGIAFRLLDRREMDIANPNQVAEVLKELRPWAVINTAGYVRVAQAESEPAPCRRENVTGAVRLAETCQRMGIKLVNFSSDLVFDGRKNQPYLESDLVNPQGVYGSTKADMERAVLSMLPSAMIVRTSAFFGPWDSYNFALLALRQLLHGDPFEAADHVYVSPTYVPDLVHATLDLLLDDAAGIWHLANAGQVSWAEFARMLALSAGMDAEEVENWYQVQVAAAAGKTPQSTVLSSERAFIMPPLEEGIRRFIRDSVPLRKLVQSSYPEKRLNLQEK